MQVTDLTGRDFLGALGGLVGLALASTSDGGG
jgi:hypothetical protein